VNLKPDNPIIVALDVDSRDDALRLVDQLGDAVDFYKVGMELYAAAGIDVARQIIASGKQVFLDMKYYDIGETVKRAVAQMARCGVSLLTVHSSGQVMRAALAGRGDSQLKVIAVTVLTSFDGSDLRELGYQCTVPELVHHLVRLAKETGVDGLVCSPLEVASVRELVGDDMILITPGVRSSGADTGDQKRVATPAQAILSGADYLVIGRQITRAPNPRAEAHRIYDEIGAARSR
jgi:orotidine-5'-phosphate decarboxylase